MNHLVKFILTVLTLFLTLSTTNADEKKKFYSDVTSASTHIEAEKQAAIEENKLLLFVLGADWCHDSTSLASKFQSKQIAKVISENYRLTLANVGNLDQGFEFVKLAGMDTFYATPTVLIIDPNTMQQLNADDMHIWANAYKVKPETTLDYFTKYANNRSLEDSNFNKQQIGLTLQLMDWVSSQEQRILQGYKLLTPILEEYVKTKKSTKQMDQYWEELAALRQTLPKVIAENKKLIKDLQQGQTIELKFPTLKPLPWERES